MKSSGYRVRLVKIIEKHEESSMKNKKNLEDWAKQPRMSSMRYVFLACPQESYSRLLIELKLDPDHLVCAVTERFHFERVRSFELQLHQKVSRVQLEAKKEPSECIRAGLCVYFSFP